MERTSSARRRRPRVTVVTDENPSTNHSGDMVVSARAHAQGSLDRRVEFQQQRRHSPNHAGAAARAGGGGGGGVSRMQSLPRPASTPSISNTTTTNTNNNPRPQRFHLNRGIGGISTAQSLNPRTTTPHFGTNYSPQHVAFGHEKVRVLVEIVAAYDLAVPPRAPRPAALSHSQHTTTAAATLGGNVAEASSSLLKKAFQPPSSILVGGGCATCAGGRRSISPTEFVFSSKPRLPDYEPPNQNALQQRLHHDSQRHHHQQQHNDDEEEDLLEDWMDHETALPPPPAKQSKPQPQQRQQSSSSHLHQSSHTATSAPGSPTKRKKIHPHCVVKHRGKTIHVTQPIKNCADPVWTVDKGSLFLLTMTMDDILQSHERRQRRLRRQRKHGPPSNHSHSQSQHHSQHHVGEDDHDDSDAQNGGIPGVIKGLFHSSGIDQDSTREKTHQHQQHHHRRTSSSSSSSSMDSMDSTNDSTTSTSSPPLKEEEAFLTFSLQSRRNRQMGLKAKTTTLGTLCFPEACTILEHCSEERLEYPLVVRPRQPKARHVFVDTHLFASAGSLMDGMGVGGGGGGHGQEYQHHHHHHGGGGGGSQHVQVGGSGDSSSQSSGDASLSMTGAYSTSQQQHQQHQHAPSKTHHAEGQRQPILALRFRIATERDVHFIRELYGTWRYDNADGGGGALRIPMQLADPRNLQRIELTTETDERQVAGLSVSHAISSTLAQLSQKNLNFLLGASSGSPLSSSAASSSRQKREELFQVKPFADPRRPRQTAFLSKRQMKEEAWGRSHTWTEAGQAGPNTLGFMYLEVLACDDLPNLDVGGTGILGNVTDAFICAVFEDCAVQTTVIDDELSPLWMPWTRRAFVFPMMHPFSKLYLGVFDYDLGPLGHEPIGRVVVNVGSMRSGTEYILRYHLHPSSNITERKPNGVVTIRLRIELKDEKAAILAGLSPPPQCHVNVKKEKSFNVVRYTCYGEYNEEKFDWTVLSSYINEIFEYYSMIGYNLNDAFKSVIFWRPQVMIGGSYLPLHSFLAFYAAINVVERPHLAVPMFFFGLAWIMLAFMCVRRHHPSPWHRCKSFWYYMHILQYGRPPPKEVGVTIAARENWKEAAAHEAAWKERVERDNEVALRRAELEEKMMEIGSERIETDVKSSIPAGFEIELMQRMDRWQMMVGGFCRFLRRVKNILTWEESILSFWLTATFLALGVAFLILPWRFLFRWIGRIIAWVFLGPWMKFVDIILHEGTSQDKEHIFRDMVKSFHERSRLVRVKREDALKRKALKVLKHGKFITNVPAFNLARHVDFPLPDSTARKPGFPLGGMIVIDGMVLSQQLFGTMIPRQERFAAENKTKSMEERDRLLSLLEGNDKCKKKDKNKDKNKDQDSSSSVSALTEKSASNSVVPSTTIHCRRRQSSADDESLEGHSSSHSVASYTASESASRPRYDASKKGSVPLRKTNSEPFHRRGKTNGRNESLHNRGRPKKMLSTIATSSTSSTVEEEGVEVVAWDLNPTDGRDDVVPDQDDAKDDDDGSDTSDNMDPYRLTRARSDVSELSSLYRSSNSVMVAFCHR